LSAAPRDRSIEHVFVWSSTGLPAVAGPINETSDPKALKPAVDERPLTGDAGANVLTGG
jgi:hypothetical protein